MTMAQGVVPAAGGGTSGNTPLLGTRVLVLSMYYRPETTGSAPYTADLAEHLAACGARVRVVTAQPHYPAWRRPDGVRNTLTVSWEEGVEVVRVRGYVPRRPTLLRRGLYEALYVACARRQLHRERPDLVVACVPSLFAGALAVSTAARLDVPCVTVVQDLISSAADQSGMDGAGRVQRLLSAVEARTFRRSAHVTVPSAAFAPVVKRFAPGTRVSVIPNWSRLTDAAGAVGGPVSATDAGPESGRHRAERGAVRRGLGWEGRFVIAHTGNMGLKQSLEDLAPALRQLSSSHPDVLVSFVGDGSRRAALERVTNGLSGTEVRDPVPGHEYPRLLAAADALLVHERSTVRDMSLPSKLTSYFAAGRPVLAVVRDDSATAAEVQRSGSGVLTAPLDAEALATQVELLKGDPEFRARLGAAGADYARRQLRPAAALDQLAGLLRDVLAGWAGTGKVD